MCARALVPVCGRNGNKASEAKRGSVLTSSAKKREEGEERRGRKRSRRRRESAACSLIRGFCLLVMLEHSSALGFVGGVCVDAVCCPPPAGSIRTYGLRYTHSYTHQCTHTHTHPHTRTLADTKLSVGRRQCLRGTAKEHLSGQLVSPPPSAHTHVGPAPCVCVRARPPSRFVCVTAFHCSCVL